MKKNYSVLDDEEKLNDYDYNISYREYKKTIRNLQIKFEKDLSELKERINLYENNIQKKNENDIYEFISNNKKKIEELENCHKNGIENLFIMKSYFSKNSTYSIEIDRYLSIFDKFKIQLQSIKNTFDKIYLNCNIYIKKENNKFINNNEINHVFKERNALEYSLKELDNIISIGENTNFKLKNQNYHIMQHIKKINQLNSYLPQIQKILKKIKYYNLKRIIILSVTISLCIFFFFIFK
ncbi:conserved Plasmodium protein, unknown function [Plasmodium gallinaceum]|uniref:SNARE protein n=1 Tax=Plasmodium gallinaceum TaxID=5849 RepID=A0A1J1GR33_PLAGA|nr:conserved Plasmodium protein, unknown function [Plasmodium gallinaceum]CRG94888.1 conserved Plasmodium protein, unknown function [Plasmodium gallinaceum]